MSPQCFIFSASFCQKLVLTNLLRQQQNTHVCQIVIVEKRSVTHSRVARAAHQVVTIKAGVCCVRVWNTSIVACIGLAVASIYKILWKSKVFLDFFGGPSGQSGAGLARRLSRFDPQQGWPLYIWMYTPSAVSICGWICGLYKSSYFIFYIILD
jgi:hypothetical protein